MPIRLRDIDDTNRDDHTRLTADDKCFFLYEFTAFEHTGGQGFRFSECNQLIHNLKKKPSERTTKGGWAYKGRAIAECASALGEALNPGWLSTGTIVPVPSSKAVGHPDYDDRLTQIAKALSLPSPDVRELVLNTNSHEAAHEATGHRPSVDDLIARYQIDEALAGSAPVRSIAILDDVLTAGTHYRAMQRVLSARFPGVPIFGIFIARRAIPKAKIEDLAAKLRALFDGHS